MSLERTGFSFKILMENIVDDGRIHVMFEQEHNEAVEHGTWIYLIFDTMKECINFFLEKYYTYKGDKGNWLKGFTDDSFSLDNNKLYFDIHSGHTFIFQNKKLCKKFYLALKKYT